MLKKNGTNIIPNYLMCQQHSFRLVHIGIPSNVSGIFETIL